MELWLVISGIILLMSTIMLVALLKPKKRKPPPPRRQPAKNNAPPPQATPSPAPQIPKLIEQEKKKRVRTKVRKWVGENPVIAARFIRLWLKEGKKRV